MKEKEIQEELELCIRSFLDSIERSKQISLDNFDELRILEGAFNRLFMSVEHLFNAVMLFEHGNYSRKHFGDFMKLKELNEKYKSDLPEIYQSTYNFRSFGDYRKFPEVKEKFNREELKSRVISVNKTIIMCFDIIGTKININELKNKLKMKNETIKNEEENKNKNPFVEDNFKAKE